LRWLLLLEEYGVTFEYLQGKKQKNVVADALSRLDIDSLKIQEEELLTFLSGSETTASVISNEQSQCILPWSSKNKQKSRNQNWEKRASPTLITQYNILKGMIFFATKKAYKIYIPQSWIYITKSTVQVPWILTSSGTDKKINDYQEYHDMAWSYTRCWTLIA
jgi:hypothetical protein